MANAPAVTVIVPESVAVRAPEVARIVAVPAPCAVNVALFESPAATRSPAATLPVFVGRDHPEAATFATKLPYVSRVIE